MIQIYSRINNDELHAKSITKKTINHFSTESHHHKNPSRKIIPSYNIFHQRKKHHFFPPPPELKFQRFESRTSFIDREFVAIPSFILRVKSLAGRNVFGDEKFRLYDVHDNNYEAQPQLRSRINSSFIDRICLSSCRQRRLVQYASVAARITRPGKWNWLEPSFSLSLHLRSAIISFIFILRSSNFSVSSFPIYFQKSFQKVSFRKRKKESKIFRLFEDK